jgi:(2Fe-2S) ferredoxin
MYYKKHVFICQNKKEDGSGCGVLAQKDAVGFFKKNLKQNDLWGEGKIRVSRTGCLGRCSEGPTCVIYPDGVWYNYLDEDDLHEIFDQHIMQDKIVKKLLI